MPCGVSGDDVSAGIRGQLHDLYFWILHRRGCLGVVWNRSGNGVLSWWLQVGCMRAEKCPEAYTRACVLLRLADVLSILLPPLAHAHVAL